MNNKHHWLVRHLSDTWTYVDPKTVLITTVVPSGYAGHGRTRMVQPKLPGRPRFEGWEKMKSRFQECPLSNQGERGLATHQIDAWRDPYLSAVCSRDRLVISCCFFLHHGHGMAPASSLSLLFGAYYHSYRVDSTCLGLVSHTLQPCSTQISTPYSSEPNRAAAS